MNECKPLVGGASMGVTVIPSGLGGGAAIEGTARDTEAGAQTRSLLSST